jgi:N6-adenosine-specific RNA methylase IME4
VAFVWHKGKTNPGFYTMSETELCLVFKRGKIPTPRGSRNERQFLYETRREHSRKPEEIRKRIERMFPSQSKYEMFARTQTPGWDTFGNQTNTFEYHRPFEELFEICH